MPIPQSPTGKYHALLLVSGIAPGPDATGGIDAKAGDPSHIPHTAIDPPLAAAGVAALADLLGTHRVWDRFPAQGL